MMTIRLIMHFLLDHNDKHVGMGGCAGKGGVVRLNHKCPMSAHSTRTQHTHTAHSTRTCRTPCMYRRHILHTGSKCITHVCCIQCNVFLMWIHPIIATYANQLFLIRFIDRTQKLKLTMCCRNEFCNLLNKMNVNHNGPRQIYRSCTWWVGRGLGWTVGHTTNWQTLFPQPCRLGTIPMSIPVNTRA